MLRRFLRASAVFAVLCIALLPYLGCAGISSSSKAAAAESDVLASSSTFSISGSISPSANGSATTVSLGGASSATTTTDANGNYTFTGLANGGYMVMPSKNGFYYTPATKSVTLSGANVTAVNFAATEIPATFTISGTINPGTDGTDTTVTLSGAASMTATADASGNYIFKGLSAGTYTVTPTKSGYSFSPASQNAIVTVANVAGQNFMISPDTPAPTYTISGSLNPSTNGSGASVTLSGATSATTTADSSGNFSFSGVASGNYTVTPAKDGFGFTPAMQSTTVNGANVTVQSFTVSENSSTSLYSIAGTIGPTASGTGATVTVSGAASLTVTADSNGNYVLSNLPTGTYTVTATKSGYSFSPASASAAISSANVTGVNFTASAAAPPTYSISGTISGSAAGATVTLSGAASHTTTVTSSGTYSFSGLASGAYTLTASKSGYTFSPSGQGATINKSNVTGMNFTATENPPPTYSISGTVSPAANGSGAAVVLTGAASAAVTANSSGNFIFSNLPAGAYTITVSKSGFSFSPTNQSETINTADISGVEFTATASTPTYSISGTLNPTGNGSGSTVVLSGAANATTTANSSGAFTFTGLAAGSYTVTPSKSSFNFSPSSQNANISNGSVSVSFTVSPVVAGPNTINIFPGNNIPAIVTAAPAGTTFVIYPGTYRLTQSIIPKNGDSFVGKTACAPPTIVCPAIISGSTAIGSFATFDGTNYQVADQTQQGKTSPSNNVCDTGWSGCIYPEDLFFDGTPYQHLNSATLPDISTGQWWFDYTNHIIYFHDDPSGHTVETSILNNAFGGPANNVTIQYLTVEEFANMFPTGAIGTAQGTTPQTQGANWIVQNNEVLLNHGFGVRVGYGTQILNNYIHDNGQTGIGGGIGMTSAPATESMNSGVLIQGNVVNHNDYAHFNAGFGSGGIKTGGTSGIVIRGNTIQHNEGSGIHFDMNSQNELVDGNTITDNSDADGLLQEIGFGTSTFRNNVVQRNGAQVNATNVSFQIDVRASSGVNIYCNVMQPSSGPGINAWSVGASPRGYSAYPPFQYLASTGNSVHHNTVIWDVGATGTAGYLQNDAANQPNFFASNTPPDFNTYHLPLASVPYFIYDDNNSQRNAGQAFTNYQSAGADVHGMVDTNYASGYPAVSITAPSDQSTVNIPAMIMASATDVSGISKVEFFVDWVLQGTASSSPYNFTWTNAAAGSHTVAAMAYSNAGVSSCYAVTLNVR